MYLFSFINLELIFFEQYRIGGLNMNTLLLFCGCVFFYLNLATETQQGIMSMPLQKVSAGKSVSRVMRRHHRNHTSRGKRQAIFPVPFSNAQDFLYYGTISIGTPDISH